MVKGLENKTAIVTGGCRGIGKAIVERLAHDGAKVFAFDYVIPKPDEVFIEEIDIKGLVKCIQVDVTQDNSVNNAVQEVMNDTGRIDILINNAGITRDNLLMRMSETEWDSVLNTNLKGAFLCTKAVSRIMMNQRSGRIINMGSIVGSIGNAGQVNYSSSKAGLIGMTKSLAKELGSRNILVNLIAPGYVITPMTEKLTDEQKQLYINNIPLKRGALPKDIANAVAFFTSDDSAYITGQVMHVDGGLAI
ncbi:MAG: 3-oxoacyl-[acyl-carrier-protein] reductase [Ignavibacteria bacterium GWB2_35_12]|nr:MAG: 3-oxoacyl-[acyl-carrier-protein] reductase [Ignavibacteria bacterium GWA2_35_8]OGU41630.1 MAG: 3-oxoacyl-[acyl-carrier-protein] reductase [Ignavibacteria bacterium GWB2_35_12]OGU91370.1 MAG: 3-oxoacyl-[acyl-carrier-protein] reductase [Ignavibacteria bacterium RIFOXYA2_FULL_35_10]OGV24964.1 MAG: 3-oxoacyl-[acyl-carrier-protein] reductase [Ignavibacteria bacterium RIFOXYC2_FULL_35_21]